MYLQLSHLPPQQLATRLPGISETAQIFAGEWGRREGGEGGIEKKTSHHHLSTKNPQLAMPHIIIPQAVSLSVCLLILPTQHASLSCMLCTCTTSIPCGQCTRS